MTVVDTSFLLALHDPEDRFHARATARSLTHDRYLVPWEIWTEMCHVLSLRYHTEDAQRILASIKNGPFEVRNVLSMNDSMEIAAGARLLHERGREFGLKPLTFFDLVVCHLAARFREGILTFDQGMITAIRERWFPGARLA